MSEQTPEPLIELPAPPRERLTATAARYVRRHRARIAAGAAVVVGGLAFAGHFLGGIAGLWEMYKLATGKHGSPAQEAAPLMSVAVLPFTSALPDAEHQRATERITQDVTSAIERTMRFALVVSHGLAGKYTKWPVDARAAGRDLNVRYLLQGDVREERGTLVATVQLLDTGNGKQVWSDRVSADGGAASGANADITGQLANRVRAALYDAERERAARLPTAKAGALELVLRADAQWEQDPTPKGLAEARKLYEEALQKDPYSASALIGLFRTTYGRLFEDLGADRDRFARELDDLSLRAVRADRNDPRAWLARGNALAFQWKWDAALDANSEALRIDPYRSSTLGYRATLLRLTGRAEEALPFVERAIALDPRGSAVLHHGRCAVLQYLGRYDDAIGACEKALSLEDNWYFRLRLVSLYAHKGEMDKAQGLKAELLKRKPNVSIAGLKALRTSDNAVFLQQVETHFFAGLRKVGIPEQR